MNLPGADKIDLLLPELKFMEVDEVFAFGFFYQDQGVIIVAVWFVWLALMLRKNVFHSFDVEGDMVVFGVDACIFFDGGHYATLCFLFFFLVMILSANVLQPGNSLQKNTVFGIM